VANHDETTRRILPLADNVSRADARLKLVKAVDEVATAMEKLHVAVQKAHGADVRVALTDFPCVPFIAKKGEMAVIDVPTFARGVMLWAAHLHDPGKFDDLGTKRFPDHHG